MLNPNYLSGQSPSYSRCFKHWPTCQSYQSTSSRHKSPLLTLFSSQAGLARWVVPKMFNGTFNALPVMVCKHFPKMVLFEVCNAVSFPAEIHTQVNYFRGKGMFHRPWSDWGKRIPHWDGLLSWWAFVMHQFWAIEKSGTHLFTDCCNSKIWVLFSALLSSVHCTLYNSLSQVLSNGGFSLV